MFIVDFSRVQHQQAPIFYYTSAGLQDGGTIEYSALGYKVYKFHKIENYGYFEGIYICHSRKTYSELYSEITK